MSDNEDRCQTKDCGHYKTLHENKKGVCNGKNGKNCNCQNFKPPNILTRTKYWKLDTKIAIVLLIGIPVTFIPFYVPTVSLTEQTFRIESYQTLLENSGNGFAAVYAADKDSVAITVQVQSAVKDGSNEITASVKNKDGGFLSNPDFVGRTVNPSLNFKPFVSNYTGFYLIYLDNSGLKSSDQKKHVFVVANITTTKTKERMLTDPTSFMLNISSVAGPTLIGASSGIFITILIRRRTG